MIHPEAVRVKTRLGIEAAALEEHFVLAVGLGVVIPRPVRLEHDEVAAGIVFVPLGGSKNLETLTTAVVTSGQGLDYAS